MTANAHETQIIADVMDPARAVALQASLGLADPALTEGDALPPFWHQIYFWDAQPPSCLGHDGHPATGTGIVPDMGLAHRMWAGGDLEFLAPITLGRRAVRKSTMTDATRKEGRSGPLAFVRLLHEIEQDGRTCVREVQELVYRGPLPDERPAPPVAKQTPDASLPVSFYTTLLFRYSALTFNGHRIHYDLDHSTGPEGYKGLVVHGPLLATLLVGMADRAAGPLKRFQFRAVSPLMHFEKAQLCMSGRDLWVEGPDRRLCMQATIE
jgi:3-methylfumaryl-CoA hydratase